MAGTVKDRAGFLSKIPSVFSKLSSIFAARSSDVAVGLSIGASSIKCVELQKVKGNWKLVHFGLIQLPEDAIVNREIMNPVAVSESLKTLANQLKLKTKNVCTSISGNGVLVKRMTVEVPNPRDLQDQVFWEAEQYLPFDISEVVMDYHSLTGPKEKQADVILVAAKRSLVESYMTAISGAGLKPKFVDIDFFALQNLYETNYPTSPTESVAIVDIGATSLKTVVIHNGVPVFTKDSTIGGKNVTAEIQKQMNLSFADAEAMKVGASAGGVPQELQDLLQHMAENFAGEIKRSIDFYNASTGGAPISAIILSGGSVRIPNLSRVVEEQTGLPTQIVNPFNAISYDPSIFTDDYITQIAAIAAIPIGLAIRAGAGD